MITENARDVLAVIYAPASAPDTAIEAALRRFGERLAQFTGATAARIAICR